MVPASVRADSAAYNLGFSARVVSAFDTGLFRAAVERLVDRHPILRSVYRMSDGRSVASHSDGFLAPLFVQHDAAGLSEAELSDCGSTLQPCAFRSGKWADRTRAYFLSIGQRPCASAERPPHRLRRLVDGTLMPGCEIFARRRPVDGSPTSHPYTPAIPISLKTSAGCWPAAKATG